MKKSPLLKGLWLFLTLMDDDLNHYSPSQLKLFKGGIYAF